VKRPGPARAGVHETSLMGMAWSSDSRASACHTRGDTVDKINPAATEAAIRLGLRFVEVLDRGEQDKAKGRDWKKRPRLPGSPSCSCISDLRCSGAPGIKKPPLLKERPFSPRGARELFLSAARGQRSETSSVSLNQTRP